VSRPLQTVPIDNHVVKLQIWDTAGQERFRTITTSYFRGAQGILLVYDVQDRGSFENISNWVGQIEQHADINVTKVLIGNKCDADPSKIQVTEAEGQALADQYGIKFFLTSAKNNIRVTEAFEAVARDVKNRLMKDGVGKTDASKAAVVISKTDTPAGGAAAGGCCGGGA
jgi:Ras-related protein Rab-8A